MDKITPTTTTTASPNNTSASSQARNTVDAKVLHNPNVPPPRPTWNVESLRQFAPLTTLEVSVAVDGVSPAKRATRLEGTAASFIRLRYEKSGPVVIAETFERNQIPWEDDDRETVIAD